MREGIADIWTQRAVSKWLWTAQWFRTCLKKGQSASLAPGLLFELDFTGFSTQKKLRSIKQKSELASKPISHIIRLRFACFPSSLHNLVNPTYSVATQTDCMEDTFYLPSLAAAAWSQMICLNSLRSSKMYDLYLFFSVTALVGSRKNYMMFWNSENSKH